MKNNSPTSDIYTRIGMKATEIEEVLQGMKRWQADQLPEEKFENMGAFGSNTMTFEQWLQFILIPRIKQIVRDREEFPSNSMLSAYASRIFDGDHEAIPLQELLYDIDQLINDADSSAR